MQDVGNELRREWWGLLVTGFASISFGLVALVWPGLTVAVFALLIAVLILVFGVIDIINGIRGLKVRLSKALQIILGIAQVAVAVYLLDHASKGIALALVSLVIALTFIARGIINLFLTFDRESDVMSRWLSAASAVLAIIVAILIMRYPVQGTLAYVWLVGLFAIVTGSFEVALGFQAKESQPQPKKRTTTKKK